MAVSYSLYAQEPVVIKMKTEGANSAYNVPVPIRVNFESNYPDMKVVTWEPSTGWWHVTYKGDNRINHVYYSTQLWYIEHPMSYSVALPVTNTYVPDEVAAAAVNLYGNSLYSITKMKSANDADVYQVSLTENGTVRSTWMDAQGVVVTDDIYKVKTDNDKIKVKDDSR